MIKKSKYKPQESRLNDREALAAILGDPNIIVQDLDARLDELRRQGFPETLIEDLRFRLNIGTSEPS